MNVERKSPTDWITVAEQLAQALAPGAAARDQAGGEADIEVDLLRQSGLLSFLNPVELGGGGGSYPQSQTITRILAAADSNAAQILSYHYLLSHNALLRATPDQRKVLLRDSIAEQWLWGGASNPRDASLALTLDKGGLRLNGRKNFASNASVADRIVSVVDHQGSRLLLLVPQGAAGLHHGHDWTAFGQRRGVSGSIRFDDVALSREAVLGPFPPEPNAPADPRLTLSVPLHQLYFVNLYLGTAQGALAEARRYVIEEARPWQTSGAARASDDPYVLEQFGYLSADLQASVALAEAVAEDWQTAWEAGAALTPAARDQVAARVYAAKVNATRTALVVTGQIFELLGARATAARYGFDRFWRNVRTHSLHDPLAYKAREVGNHAFHGVITPDPLYT